MIIVLVLSVAVVYLSCQLCIVTGSLLTAIEPSSAPHMLVGKRFASLNANIWNREFVCFVWKS